MGSSEVIVFAAYALAGLLVVAALAVVPGALLHAERAWRRYVLPAVVPMILLAVAVNNLTSGRNLNLSFGDLAGIAPDPLAVWLNRVVSAVVVGACAARVFVGLVLTHHPKPDPLARALIGAYLFYFLTNEVLNALFGTWPAFEHRAGYQLLVVLAVYASRDEPLDRIVMWAKLAALAVLALSLAILVMQPELVLQTNYKGWIPGFDVRYWGLGNHANSIGPLALLLLLLSYLQPWHSRTLGLFAVLVATASLILSQSKTAWLAGLMATVAIALHRSSLRRGVDAGALRVALVSTVFASLGIAFFLADVQGLWARGIRGEMAFGLASVSGRTPIWDAALKAWQDNWLFGYGTEAWGPRHRIQIGIPNAFSAHNDYMQAISRAGAIGFVGLLVYLSVLFVASWRRREATRGVSLALLLVILLRSITETPLSATFLSVEFTYQVITFAIFMLHMSSYRPRSEAYDSIMIEYSKSENRKTILSEN